MTEIQFCRMKSQKKLIDGEVNTDTLLRFSHTLDDYLKISVGNDVLNFTKYDKKQNIVTLVIKYANQGRYLLQNWLIKCIDKNNNGKMKNL